MVIGPLLRSPHAAVSGQQHILLEVIQYGRELIRDHRVSQATYDAALAKFGEQGLTELTGTIGYYGMLACTLNGFEVEPTSDMASLPE